MILFKPTQPIDLSSVDIHTEPEVLGNISHDTQKQINTLWQLELDKAIQEGKVLFDSSIWSFQDIVQKDSRLILRLGKVPYSVRYIAKQYPQVATKLGKQKAAFTHIFLKLSDDNYIFLRRSNHFTTDLKISFVGGAFTAEQSLIEHTSEELREEVGLAYKDLKKPKLLGVYENEFGNCGIVVSAELHIDKNTMSKHFTTWMRSISKPEATDLLFVHQSEMKNFFSKKMIRYIDALTLLCEDTSQ